MALRVPCLLCGEVHPLQIHSYLQRKIRIPETGSNETILIVVVICRRAKALGKQYCKRVLPPFVTPFCVIRRDVVLDYLRRYSSGALHYREAMTGLGAWDKRTLGRHIADGVALIRQSVMEIVAVLAQVAFLASVPEHSVGEAELQYLQRTSVQFNRACQAVHGAQVAHLPAVYFVSLCGVEARWGWRSSPAISTTSVLRALVFRATAAPRRRSR